MVLPRVLTAVVMLPLVLAVIWFGSLPYFLFVLAIALLGFWEYSMMAEEGGYPNQFGMGLIGTGFIILALFLDGVIPWGPLHVAPTPYLVFILWFFCVFLREFIRQEKGHSFLRIITTVSGVLICSLLLGHMLLLRDIRLAVGEGFQNLGREVVFFLFFIVWSVDIGAWAFGRMIGRSPMAPRISPKKTWEGAVAGTILACFMGWVLREAFLKPYLQTREAVLFAFLIAIIAQISDLIESLLKRSFGVKNSSEILPGHGGILDRFDSFIFAAPFFYYLLLGTGRFQ